MQVPAVAAALYTTVGQSSFVPASEMRIGFEVRIDSEARIDFEVCTSFEAHIVDFEAQLCLQIWCHKMRRQPHHFVTVGHSVYRICS